MSFGTARLQVSAGETNECSFMHLGGNVSLVGNQCSVFASDTHVKGTGLCGG